MTQQDGESLLPEVLPAEHEAVVNVTYEGQNGDLLDPIPFDSSDAEIKQMVTEAVRDGVGVRGLGAYPSADFADFVVDRFNATHDQPVNRVFVRPKTPFGS